MKLSLNVYHGVPPDCRHQDCCLHLLWSSPCTAQGRRGPFVFYGLPAVSHSATPVLYVDESLWHNAEEVPIVLCGVKNGIVRLSSPLACAGCVESTGHSARFFIADRTRRCLVAAGA